MSKSSWLVDKAHIEALRDPQSCPQRSSQWFLERNYRLGASEVPFVLQSSTYQNAANVIQAKLDPKPSHNATTAQKNGIDNEELAVRAFLDSPDAAELSISSCKEAGLYVHPEEPWLWIFW